MFIYQATVDKVVDGDTLDLQLDLGFGVFTRQRVRLLGINAAEHGTELGDKATAFAKAWVQEHGPTFTVRTQKDKKEKYGRYLATVLSDTADLGQTLIDAGLAVPYDGNGPRPVPESVP
ncbi:thermonuclease family protein [Streptomyces mirabilis]|uniref:thermonuclease family protein n=1 Tax=Streptomyces mirabilis TaxID=68239 RepID=UPI00369C1FFE